MSRNRDSLLHRLQSLRKDHAALEEQFKEKERLWPYVDGKLRHLMQSLGKDESGGRTLLLRDRLVLSVEQVRSLHSLLRASFKTLRLDTHQRRASRVMAVEQGSVELQSFRPPPVHHSYDLQPHSPHFSSRGAWRTGEEGPSAESEEISSRVFSPQSSASLWGNPAATTSPTRDSHGYPPLPWKSGGYEFRATSASEAYQGDGSAELDEDVVDESGEEGKEEYDSIALPAGAPARSGQPVLDVHQASDHIAETSARLVTAIPAVRHSLTFHFLFSATLCTDRQLFVGLLLVFFSPGVSATSGERRSGAGGIAAADATRVNYSGEPIH